MNDHEQSVTPRIAREAVPTLENEAHTIAPVAGVSSSGVSWVTRLLTRPLDHLASLADSIWLYRKPLWRVPVPVRVVARGGRSTYE